MLQIHFPRVWATPASLYTHAYGKDKINYIPFYDEHALRHDNVIHCLIALQRGCPIIVWKAIRTSPICDVIQDTDNLGE